MPVHVLNNWPTLEVVFDDFPTGESALMFDHVDWLNRVLLPILKYCSAGVMFVGGASRLWTAGPNRNRQLSQDRIHAVKAYLRDHQDRIMNLHFDGGLPMGSSVAHLGPDAAGDRAVAMFFHPLRDEGVAYRARTRIIEGLQQLIDEHGAPGAGSTGDERYANWEPYRALLQGYGLAIRQYLTDSNRSRTTFTNDIYLPPRRIFGLPGAGRSRNAGFGRGEEQAFHVFNALSADERWNVNHFGPNPSQARELLRALCRKFREIWQRYASSDLRWAPGGCDFYTEREERAAR